jgi:hypothetical protein
MKEIELRFVHRNVAATGHADSFAHARILQFRTGYYENGDDTVDPVWSEWKDVPDVGFLEDENES